MAVEILAQAFRRLPGCQTEQKGSFKRRANSPDTHTYQILTSLNRLTWECERHVLTKNSTPFFLWKRDATNTKKKKKSGRYRQKCARDIWKNVNCQNCLCWQQSFMTNSKRRPKTTQRTLVIRPSLRNNHFNRWNTEVGGSKLPLCAYTWFLAGVSRSHTHKLTHTSKIYRHCLKYRHYYNYY